MGSIVSTDNLVNLESLDVFPNPAFESASVQASFTQVERVRLRMVNATGKQIREDLFFDRQINHTIDLRALPTGIYFLELQTARGRAIRKLVHL